MLRLYTLLLFLSSNKNKGAQPCAPTQYPLSNGYHSTQSPVVGFQIETVGAAVKSVRTPL